MAKTTKKATKKVSKKAKSSTKKRPNNRPESEITRDKNGSATDVSMLVQKNNPIDKSSIEKVKAIRSGRPSKFDPEFHCQSYIEMCEKGFSRNKIAGKWLIRRETIHDWAKAENEQKYKGFSNAVCIGDQIRETWYEDTFIDMSKGLVQGSKGELLKFVASNTIGWSDRQKTEVDARIESVEGCVFEDNDGSFSEKT